MLMYSYKLKVLTIIDKRGPCLLSRPLLAARGAASGRFNGLDCKDTARSITKLPSRVHHLHLHTPGSRTQSSDGHRCPVRYPCSCILYAPLLCCFVLCFCLLKSVFPSGDPVVVVEARHQLVRLNFFPKPDFERQLHKVIHVWLEHCLSSPIHSLLAARLWEYHRPPTSLVHF